MKRWKYLGHVRGCNIDQNKKDIEVLVQEILQFDSAKAELAARQTDEESCIAASSALQMCVRTSEVRNIFFAQMSSCLQHQCKQCGCSAARAHLPLR